MATKKITVHFLGGRFDGLTVFPIAGDPLTSGAPFLAVGPFGDRGEECYCCRVEFISGGRTEHELDDIPGNREIYHLGLHSTELNGDVVMVYGLLSFVFPAHRDPQRNTGE